MASIKCSCCENGIHYHDEANGTQFLAFRKETWATLTASDLWISRYILDGTEDYYVIWKCGSCGAIHIFEADSPDLKAAYKKVGVVSDTDDFDVAFVAYSDYEWEKITESRITGTDLSTQFPDLEIIHASCSRNALLIKSNKDSETWKYEKLDPLPEAITQSGLE